MRDLIYSVRQIRRAPGFFLIAMLMIALGLASATLIFTLVDALLLRPLPVRDPESLVQLFEQQPNRPADVWFDYSFYRQLSQTSSALVDVTGQVDTTRAMEWNRHSERVHAVAVTDNYFSKLGVSPLIGRLIGAGDTNLAVLSHFCWSRSFGRDPKVIGKVVRLQGRAFAIAAVTPEPFTGTTLDSSPDLWIPFAALQELWPVSDPNLDNRVTEIIARLRPGVTAARAQEESSALWSRYVQEDSVRRPGNYLGLKKGKLEVRSISGGVSGLRDQSRSALLLLLAGTGLLLLMVCANVGGLLLARVTAREREISIRVALGASRWRIVRQLLSDSMLLTFCGSCLGLIVTCVTLPVLTQLLPPARGGGFDPAEVRTLAIQPALDFRVGAFALALFVVTILLSTLTPAWRLWNSDLNLKSVGNGRNRLFQAVLCGAQIALCTTIVLSAGLILRSVANLRGADTGLDLDRVTIFAIDPHLAGYDGVRTWAVEQRLLESVRNLPGVEGAALADRALMRGIGLGTAVTFPGQPPAGIINTSSNSVSPGYFAVMGIKVMSGRDFDRENTASNGLTKTIVNQAFVRKFLNGRNPLGEEFAVHGQSAKPTHEIIGVVSDSKYRSLREVPPPTMYTNDFGPKAYPDTFILHVRTRGDSRAVIDPVRRALRSVDPELPVYHVSTMMEQVDRSLWRERLLAVLTSGFGVFAMALAGLGLYWIMEYFVARRRREIGLCMALGAEYSDIVRMVIQRIIPPFVLGLAAGAAVSWFAGAWIRSLLFGVGPFDAAASGTAILLLGILGTLAAVVPIFRAVRIDPASVLRQD